MAITSNNIGRERRPAKFAVEFCENMSSMEIQIVNSPGHAAAKVTLAGGEQLMAESGAMIAMNSDVEVSTSTKNKGGGFLKGMKRMLAGESLFLNTFTAPHQGGELYLAPTLVGDMTVYHLDGTKELTVQGGSYVASGTDVEMDTTWQGLKSSFLSGESIFWIKLSGTGPVILSSFGGIYERDISDTYIVDTGHIVAFENSLSFEVKKATTSLISSFLGGEGFVCHFSGHGRLFCQTHHANNFGCTLGPNLKPRK